MTILLDIIVPLENLNFKLIKIKIKIVLITKII